MSTSQQEYIVEKAQPAALRFCTPAAEGLATSSRSNALHFAAAAGGPQFVVMELGNSVNRLQMAASRQSAAAGSERSNATTTTTKTARPPFVPIGHSLAAFHGQQQQQQHQQKKEGGNDQEVSNSNNNCPPNGHIQFTMLQLSENPLSVPAQNKLAGGRLLFDNPMFRRLPNWHFFGDDHRLAPIPPLIPLLPFPVERNLLYIAPSLGSVRQMVLLTLMNSRNCIEAAGNEVEEGNEGIEECSFLLASASGTEDHLLDRGCASSSGVESLSTDEASRSTPSTTPGSGESTPSRLWTPTPNGERLGDNLMAVASCQIIKSAGTEGSSANSATSSSPNSPPIFDRRTQVRLSRASRDAVFRLSRRFSDDDMEMEIDEDEHHCVVPLAPLNPMTMVSEQMAVRTRHTSSGSTCTGSRSPQHQRRPIQVAVDKDGICRMDVLSECILNFHQNMEQKHVQLNRKLMLRDQLYYAISPIFPMCGLYIVGSSLNGFGTSNSDLDLCLMITNREIDQRSDAIVVLSSVMRTLKCNNLVVNQQLIPAKVPILRINFSGAFSDIMVDLNVNNSVAIRNTHLMCYYSNFDWRLRPLVMVVKEWAKRRGINNASRSSFTSYSLVLMVIHYLQCGSSPPILPSLQKLYPKRFSPHLDVRTLNVSLPLEPCPGQMWKFDLNMALSELLLGLLHYYAFEFNFDTDAISIRNGKKMPREQVAQNQSPFNTLSQWHCICIEEPFTLSNAAHSIYDGRIFQEIKDAFVDGYHELELHRDLHRFLGTQVANVLSTVVVIEEKIIICEQSASLLSSTGAEEEEVVEVETVKNSSPSTPAKETND